MNLNAFIRIHVRQFLYSFLKNLKETNKIDRGALLGLIDINAHVFHSPNLDPPG
jgi:hypothetical protein